MLLHNKNNLDGYDLLSETVLFIHNIIAFACFLNIHIEDLLWISNRC